MKRIIIILGGILAALGCSAAQAPESSNLWQRRIAFIGDSYVRNHKNKVEDTWHYKLAAKYGMAYYNYGRNGNCIAFNRGKYGKPICERYVEMRDDLDYVVMIAGHNDANYITKAEGKHSLPKEQQAELLRTFTDKLDQLCVNLRKKYPKSTIVFISPWRVGRAHFADVIEAERAAAARHCFAFYDASLSGVDPNDAEMREKWFQGKGDMAHLNPQGHDMALAKFEEFFLSLKPYTMAAVADEGPNASRAIAETRVAADAQVREEKLWNFGWKFRIEDDFRKCRGFADPGLDDGDWRVVDIPHDYLFELPWDRQGKAATGFKPTKNAWYRKHFTPGESWKGRRVLVEFEGLMVVADVYLNGEKVASSEYGYLGTWVDIGGRLKWGEDNVIAVRCDQGRRGGSRWYTGGGIVRDVRLVVKGEVSVARHGLYVTADSDGNVKASVQLDGFKYKGRANRLDVILDVVDPGGKTVAHAESAAGWSKMEHQEVALPAMKVESPKLWDLDSPVLYTAVATLRLNGEVVDKVEDRFGFRSIAYGPGFGFRLNGRKVWLQGFACHADYGAVGCAAYERAIRRQFETMKRFGFNAMRCSHNPYSEGMLRLADEMGILVVDELFDKWSDRGYWIGRCRFTDVCFDLCTEWVKRDRNHPSVVMWSLGNELQMNEDLAGFRTDDWGVTTYRLLDVIVKRWDSTRPTTVAMFPAIKGAVGRKDKGFNDPGPEPPELSVATEVASFNYLYANYPSYRRHHPELVIFQSEATVNDMQRPIAWMDRATTVGLCYWGAVEYWGESDGWPKKGWNYSFFSHTLEPYPSAYLIKSFFSKEPVVRIGVVKGDEGESVEWNDVKVGRSNVVECWDFSPGDRVKLYTYTNAEKVRLEVNGAIVGERENPKSDKDNANVIAWEGVPYERGSVAAIAIDGGKEVARHVIETADKARKVRVVCESPCDWNGDGVDLKYVRVYAVDEKGRVDRTAANKVSFSVDGDASLIAVDNGDHCTNELFHNVDSKNMKDGFVMAILRSKRGGKSVKLTVSAEGLAKETVDFALVPMSEPKRASASTADDFAGARRIRPFRQMGGGAMSRKVVSSSRNQ